MTKSAAPWAQDRRRVRCLHQPSLLRSDFSHRAQWRVQRRGTPKQDSRRRNAGYRVCSLKVWFENRANPPVESPAAARAAHLADAATNSNKSHVRPLHQAAKPAPRVCFTPHCSLALLLSPGDDRSARTTQRAANSNADVLAETLTSCVPQLMAKVEKLTAPHGLWLRRPRTDTVVSSAGRSSAADVPRRGGSGVLARAACRGRRARGQRPAGEKNLNRRVLK